MITREKVKISQFNVKQIFSNSLIIHEEKTKEITAMKEGWIPDPNYHKIWRSFALIFSKNYQYFDIRYPNTSKLV